MVGWLGSGVEGSSAMCLGVPGRIVEIVDVDQQLVVAEVDGRPRQISVALLGIAGEAGGSIGEGSDPITVGDWVDIHLGFAMAKMDEAEATEALAGLHELAESYEREMAELRGEATARDPVPPAAGGSS